MLSRKKSNGIVISLVFLAMVLLNSFTIYTSDDISYLYVYESHMPTSQTRPIEDLGDVVESISNHYEMVNGRSLSHFILQSMAILGKPAFNLANSLAYVLTGLLIMAHIERDPEKRSWPGYLALYSAIFLTFPQFGQAALWISGSVNYLWMLNFILLASLAFRKWDAGEKVNPILTILFNLAAGLASENGGGMVILFGLLCLVKWILEKRRLGPAPALSILAASLGLIYQLISPGNAIRAGESNIEVSLGQQIIRWLEVSWETSGILMVLVLILGTYSLVMGKKIEGILLPYLISGLASAAVMVLTPNLAGRSWLWLVAFLLITIGILAKDLDPLRSGSLSKGISLALACLSLIAYGGALKDIHKSYEESQAGLAQLQEQKLAGQTEAIIKRPEKTTNKYNPLSATYHLREDPDYWFNQWYAFQYGLDSVTISNPEDQR